MLIAYDSNGETIKVGNWQFDNEILLEVNAKNNIEPIINFEYVFVKKEDELEITNKPVLNEISDIISLTIDQKTHYFKNHTQAVNYVYEYIDKIVQRRN